MASSRLASSITLSGGTKTNSASLSTKCLISHGQPTRSTLTRSRVIHFIFLHPPLVAARSSAARSRQIHGVTFSIRYWPTASSALKAIASFSENGDQMKRWRNSRSGAFSLRRVNTISKNPPEFTAHSEVSVATIAVHFRCKFGCSIGESRTSLMVKVGRQRFCASAGVTAIRVSVTANVNLERRIASIVSSVVPVTVVRKSYSKLGRSHRCPRLPRPPKPGAECDREARAIHREARGRDGGETVEPRTGEMHDNPAAGRDDGGAAGDADKRPQRTAGGLERGRQC